MLIKLMSVPDELECELSSLASPANFFRLSPCSLHLSRSGEKVCSPRLLFFEGSGSFFSSAAPSWSKRLGQEPRLEREAQGQMGVNIMYIVGIINQRIGQL